MRKNIKKQKPVVLCVDDEHLILNILQFEIKDTIGTEYTIETADNGEKALIRFKELLDQEYEVPIVIADYYMPKMKGDELLISIHEISPDTLTIMLTGRAKKENITNVLNKANLFRYLAKPWDKKDLALTLKQALNSYKQAKALETRLAELEIERRKVKQERKVIDILNTLLNNKINELENQKRELEQISKELNVATIQRLLIEQEADRMSRLLSSLRSSIKDNLFMRSVLHSIVNMLQIQLSIDRREDNTIEKIKETINQIIDNLNKESGVSKLLINKELNDISHFIFHKLTQQRKKTKMNVHKMLIGYVKAVQMALIGETAPFISKPTNLFNIIKKVKEKYREILEDKKSENKIDFIVEMHNTDISLKILDFSLINIIENLLTNSIRKLLEIKKDKKWIKIVTYEELIDNKEYIIVKWMDNGPGIKKQRKLSIFEGDSDKKEEGDHGIGLSDIRISIEAVGGFIKETGKFGQGAVFIIGFPKVTVIEEIDYDEDIECREEFLFDKKFASRKILVVDIEKQAIDKYLDFFKKAGIKNIKYAYTSKDALKIIQKEKFHPDLLIADLEMNKSNGFTLINKLKQKNINIPILVATDIIFKGKNINFDKLNELENFGVKEIVEKPIDFKLLFNITKKMLKQQIKHKSKK